MSLPALPGFSTVVAQHSRSTLSSKTCSSLFSRRSTLSTVPSNLTILSSVACKEDKTFSTFLAVFWWETSFYWHVVLFSEQKLHGLPLSHGRLGCRHVSHDYWILRRCIKTLVPKNDVPNLPDEPLVHEIHREHAVAPPDLQHCRLLELASSALSCETARVFVRVHYSGNRWKRDGYKVEIPRCCATRKNLSTNSISVLLSSSSARASAAEELESTDNARIHLSE